MANLQSSSISGSLVISGSGGNLFEVQGNNGQLFSVTDDLSSSLMSVNDISGLPILDITADGTVKLGPYTKTLEITPDSEIYINGHLIINSDGQWVGDATGLVGPQGAKGSQGTTGAQGQKGSQGTTGAQGATGAQGQKGSQGTTGAQGTRGLQGTTGAQGQKGSQGTTGAQGATGAQGQKGSQGTTGAQGQKGSQGTTGAQGQKGSQGTTGAQGQKGSQGTTGAQGTRGLNGASIVDARLEGVDLVLEHEADGPINVGRVYGNTGSQGTTGAQGQKGSQGTTGAQGQKGSQGTTGAQGQKGSQGTTGAQGTRGLQGITGAQGSTGAQGQKGSQGTTGAQGQKGSQGTQGTRGPGFTTISGDTSDDALLTANGSNAAKGNSNLTFDGNELNIAGSGSTLFSIDGVNGRLFEVTDDLSDSLFSINTVAGLPVIEAFSDNTVKIGPYNKTLEINPDSDISINGNPIINSDGQWVGSPTGLVGAQGAKGSQGTTGAQGQKGSQGTTGAQGQKGSQGTTGAQGQKGSQGTQGIKGNTGNTGGTGSRGAQGIQGIQGIKGAQGATGAQGTQGIKGNTGNTGGTGSRGAQGIQGIQGPQGAKGAQGTTGSQGIQGITGVGAQGATGPAGPNALPFYNGGTMYFRENTHWEGISGIDVIGGAGEFRFSSDTGALTVRTDGHLIASNYVYGTRFYDLNDNNYYLDPGSTSYLNEVRVNKIFDRNNGAYYLDPASTSYLNSLNVNTITLQRNSGVSRLGTATAGNDPQFIEFNEATSNAGYVWIAVSDDFDTAATNDVFYIGDSSINTTNNWRFKLLGNGEAYLKTTSGNEKIATQTWTNNSFISNATVSNDTITFTRGNGTTFSVSTSDANSNHYVSSASFNTGNGVLTLNRNGLSAVTVDLDNRYQLAGSYLTTSGKAADSDKLDGLDSSSFLRSNADDNFSGALVSTDRSKGIFGSYDSYKTDHIWSMGTSYKNASDGSNFGNLYGLAYKHTNNPTGGTMAGGHQMVWATNGNPRAALGENGVWTEKHGTSENWATSITGASVSNDTITFTRVNGSTFSVTTSDANSNHYVSSASFNTGNGILTLNRNGLSAVTVDLDNRYLLTSGKAADANLLDGINSSSFLRKDTDQTITNTGVEISFYSADDGGLASGDLATLEVFQDTSGADAFMQFHVSGDYAAYFGLAGDWNDFFVGGWSMGANRYRVFHEGNLTALTNATVSNDTITFTRSNGTTFAISTSDANSNHYVSSASFDTSNGVLTLNRNGLGAVTVDLDGRFTDNGYADAMNQHVTTTANPTFNNVYSNDWLRNNKSGKGLYNTATGQHFYSDDDDYWNVAGGSASNGIRFRDEHAGTIRGYIYANNSNQVGTLTSTGEWGVRSTSNNTTELFYNNVSKIKTTGTGARVEGEVDINGAKVSYDGSVMRFSL